MIINSKPLDKNIVQLLTDGQQKEDKETNAYNLNTCFTEIAKNLSFKIPSTNSSYSDYFAPSMVDFLLYIQLA